MTFTKLFSSITESTVWREPANVRLVWITMLAMADRRGRVWASILGLADRARVPDADCRTAIKTFISPDPDSRTKEHEGRRIEEIDGGWRLLNHEKYRAIRDVEAIKESKRNYINTRRAVERVELGRDNADAAPEADSKGSPLTAVQQIGLEKELKRIEKRLDELHASPPPTFTIVNGKALQGEDTADERKDLKKRKKEIEAVLRKANGGLA